jgi:hypothetical protein
MTFNAPPPSAPPTEDTAPQRGGFLGFLTTLPGVLTATAGVLSAAGTILYAVNDQGPTPPGGGTYNITVQGGAVPSGAAQVDAGSLSSGLDASVDDEMSGVVDSCANGDADACTTLLDQLAVECFDGYGTSCDVLYQISAVGSDYEAYGATCGGRYDWTYANSCSSL